MTRGSGPLLDAPDAGRGLSATAATAAVSNAAAIRRRNFPMFVFLPYAPPNLPALYVWPPPLSRERHGRVPRRTLSANGHFAHVSLVRSACRGSCDLSRPFPCQPAKRSPEMPEPFSLEPYSLDLTTGLPRMAAAPTTPRQLLRYARILKTAAGFAQRQFDTLSLSDI